MDNKIRIQILERVKNRLNLHKESVTYREIDAVLIEMVTETRKMNRTVNEMKDENDQEYGDVPTVEKLIKVSTDRTILNKSVVTGKEDHA